MEQEARLDEYFEIKDTVSTLRADLKDFVDNHPMTEKINELKKELKGLKEELADDDGYVAIKGKIKGLKDRQDLIKEIILAEMKESGVKTVKHGENEIVIVESLKFKKAE